MADATIAAAEPALDLTGCAREAIHTPGSIQPHGILFGLSGHDLRIFAASANVDQHLGLAADSLLGVPLDRVLDNTAAQRIAEAVRTCAGGYTRLAGLHLNGPSHAGWRSVVHAVPAGFLLEAELPQPDAELAIADVFVRFESATRRMQAATDSTTICTTLAEELRRLTGYDRVKIYRFAPDWSGEVVAEDRNDTQPSYLGLHFPASDIPSQARALYVGNLERQIPDISYTPVALHQTDPEPLDLSKVGLRSVSPVHLAYLRNMAVGASMSISILQHGRLWGLVACHHHAPRIVAPELRQTGVLLAQFAAWQLSLVADAEMVRRSLRVKAVEALLVRDITAGVHYHDALRRHERALLDLLSACGLAISSGDTITILGKTPDEERLRELLGWLRARGSERFATDHLTQVYAPAFGLTDSAGILAVPLGGMPPNFMVWFRPEILQTVRWAGDPDKAADAAGALTPRRSFATWTEQVKGRSRPWTPGEIAEADGLRDVIVDIIAQRAMELERANAELIRSNEDLEAFAYVAAHDLREPLRQIGTFGTMLERAFRRGEVPNDKTTQWFEGIQTSSRRLRTLIGDLAAYSRLDRHASPPAPTDLGKLVDAVLRDFASRIEETGATIAVDPLPVLTCDAMHMQQVFQNLISNALKYRHPDRTPALRISAALVPAADTTPSALPAVILQFTDNGIGFEDRHRDRIFEPFARLYSTDEYEGSGIGLAICRKVIHRHGGTITAGSRVGEGSTFTITLPMRPLPADKEP